jgi:outer membrane protein
MKSGCKIIYFLLILSCGQIWAQETVLSKEEALKQALESNYGILISEKEVEIAKNDKSLFNSGYLPTVTGRAGANYDLNDRTTNPEGQEKIEQENIENQVYNASLNVNYLLFDGLGRRYNYKSLKEQYNLTRLEARETIENTILQLFTVYFEVARLSENLHVLQETLEVSRERVTRAEYQYEYGQVNNLAVLNARVDVNNDSINLLQTRQQLQNTKRDLNVLLNRKMSETAFHVDTAVSFLPRFNLDLHMAEAEENNVRLLKSEAAVTISDYTIKINKAAYLPSVGLTGSYGWNRSRNAETAFFPGSTTATSGISAGLNLSWDLFDGGRNRMQVQNARILSERAELLQEQIKLEVKRDLANALGAYENKLFIFHVQEENVQTNLDNFQRTQEQYKLGQATSIEFRQAQINLLNARTSLNLAKYDAKLAEMELLRLTGNLLDTEI